MVGRNKDSSPSAAWAGGGWSQQGLEPLGCLDSQLAARATVLRREVETGLTSCALRILEGIQQELIRFSAFLLRHHEIGRIEILSRLKPSLFPSERVHPECPASRVQSQTLSSHLESPPSNSRSVLAMLATDIARNWGKCEIM